MTEALHTACSKGDLHEVQSIIESSLNQHKEIVSGEHRSLPSQGDAINALDEKHKAAIHYAVQSGNIQLVEYLLKNNALVDIKNSGGQTGNFVFMIRNNYVALHYAASLGFNDVILLLLKHRANINEKNKQRQTRMLLLQITLL